MQLFYFGFPNDKSAQDCRVLMKASGEMLTAPRSGQSSATISTTTSASEIATAAVIAKCMRKSWNPNR